jgi:hypothetical protein
MDAGPKRTGRRQKIQQKMFITERFGGCHGLRNRNGVSARAGNDRPQASGRTKLDRNTLNFPHDSAGFDIL